VAAAAAAVEVVEAAPVARRPAAVVPEAAYMPPALDG
jgi:hypothetical protein